LYKFTCECGKPVETAVKEGVCPQCKREFTLVWPADAPVSREPRAIAERYDQ